MAVFDMPNDTPIPGQLSATANDLPPLPSLIAERYEVLEQLGQGGMGQVYLCRDSLLDRSVAVKLMNKGDDSFIVRFQKEARAVSLLNHFNISQIHDFGLTQSRQPYMVMEYLKGETLDQAIKRLGHMPPPVAIDIAVQIAQGMRHAHEKGIIHRDLKPSNIMLLGSDNELRVLILDFGIAKFVEGELSGASTEAGMIIGTPSCLSPEQAQGKTLDGRSDVYSLGCMFFEMLTGSSPYQGATALATIQSHIDSPIPSPSERLGIKLGDEIESVARKALAKNRSERFESMSAFSQALDTAREKAALEATGDFRLTDHWQLPQSQKRWKAPVIAAIAVLLIALLVSPTIISLFQPNIEETKPKSKELWDSFMPGDQFAEDQVTSNFKKHRNLGLDDMIAQDRIKTKEQLVEAIRKVPTAFDFCLSNSTLDDSMIDELIDTERFTQLRLASCNVSPQAQVRLFAVPRWKRLKFLDMNISVKALKELKNNRNLFELVLERTTLKGESLEPVSLIKSLQYLTVSGMDSISVAQLEKLTRLKHLKQLFLLDCHLTGAHLKELDGLNLEALDLSANGPFSDEAFESLLAMKTLASLRLENVGLQDRQMMTLAKLPHLSMLDVSNNSDLSLAGIKVFGKRIGFQMAVGGTRISKLGPKILRQIRDEQGIDFHHQNSRAADMADMEFDKPSTGI